MNGSISTPTPSPIYPGRLTVQARQIFVYARAIMLGWSTDSARIAQAFDAMIARYHRPDGLPGFAFSVDAVGQVVDGTRDLYAHSFFLLAAAAYYQMTDDSARSSPWPTRRWTISTRRWRPRTAAISTAPPTRRLSFARTRICICSRLCWRSTRSPVPRPISSRAEMIFWQVRDRFFQPAEGTIPEYFDGAWMPVGGAQAAWEPGHHMEWSWLLSEYRNARPA